MCSAENGETFTFCTYEHRNSDSIIINGKKGYISIAGNLPYKSDNKYEYLDSFAFDQHYQAANRLYALILIFFGQNKKEDNNEST